MAQVRVFLTAFLTFCLVTITSQLALAEDKGFADGEMVLGDKNAPITVIEYASMTCPHCAHFHEETYAAFKAKYIDTGIEQLGNLLAARTRGAQCGYNLGVSVTAHDI